MPRMITSKNMGSVSELTLIADIRPELVEIRQTMTHATRLRILLRTLYGIRRAAVEETSGRRLPGPLESLEFLHFVRFALLDNDTKFLLGVTFDGAWEPYIRAIAEQAGPLLDVIFCHTEGYNAHSSDKGYAQFSKWVRAHQVEADFFFADSPATTAKDVKLLKDFHRRMCGGAPLDEAEVEPTPDDVRRGLKALHQLHGLDKFFPARHENDFLRRTSQMIMTPVADSIGKLLAHYEQLETGQQRAHQAAFDWVREPNVSWPTIPAPAPAETCPNDMRDLQGNIATAYEGMTHGATLLMRITDLAAAQKFLRELDLTRQGEALPEVTMNLGLTYRGLERLGLSAEDLAKLPQEFREGMAARAGWLGDLGPNHPSQWKLPSVNWPPETATEGGEGAAAADLRVRLSSVDFVLQLQTSASGASDDDAEFGEGHPLYAFVCERFGRASRHGVQLMAVEVQRHVGLDETEGRPFGMEHFGYLDGVSQPSVAGFAESSVVPRDRVSLGEVVLGYGDDRDGIAAEPPLEVMRNGSFQVIRKLRQDVGRFRRILAENGQVPDLAKKMMGRPLAADDPLASSAPDEIDDLLDFDFSAPAIDQEIPADSHIRRANPRNGPDAGERIRSRSSRAVPRIARRGMSYGRDYCPNDEDGGDRGLLFSCFNASLADQFEVVQRWLAGANSSSVAGLRNDPFLGLPEPGQNKTFTVFDAHGKPSTTIDLGPTPLVTLEWGLYLFAPSLSGLRELTRIDAKALCARDLASDTDVEEGEAVIRRMQTLEEVEKTRDPARAHFLMAMRWKVLIEDLSARETMRKVWAAIRARGGTLETPYGVLVGSREQIAQIFRHPKDYSVSGYWDRMRDSLGEHYLGMDPSPEPMAAHANAPARIQQDRYVAAVDRDRYRREATIANAWISSIDEEEAFQHAYGIASGVIDQFIRAGAPLSSSSPSDAEASHLTVLNVGWLVDYTMGAMCTRWFNLPTADPKYMTAGPPNEGVAHNPDNFKSTARYIFSPNPTEFVQRDGQTKGTELLVRATRFVTDVIEGRAPLAPDTLLGELIERRDELVAEGIPDRDFPGFCAGILLGTIHGFVGPVGGSVTSLLNQWIKSRELWRQQQNLFAVMPCPETRPTYAQAAAVLLEDVEQGMRLQPFPYVLHRVPVRDVVLRQKPRPRVERADGEEPREYDFEIEAGKRVVLGIVSAAHDHTQETGPDDMPITDLLFGGAYPRGTSGYGQQKTGLHACPGKAIGMGTLLGVLVAVLQSGNLRRLAPLKLELDPFPGRRQWVEPGSDPLRRRADD